jgi:hypothetical protein
LAGAIARRRSTELREERRVADHNVERVVGQVGRERVGDLDVRLWAEEPLALDNCSRVSVDTDDVARAAEATGRGDQEVAGAACRVDDADRARVEPGIEQRLQRPVEQVLDEKWWGVECAEPTALFRAQPRARASALRANALCRLRANALCRLRANALCRLRANALCRLRANALRGRRRAGGRRGRTS